MQVEEEVGDPWPNIEDPVHDGAIGQDQPAEEDPPAGGQGDSWTTINQTDAAASSQAGPEDTTAEPAVSASWQCLGLPQPPPPKTKALPPVLFQMPQTAAAKTAPATWTSEVPVTASFINQNVEESLDMQRKAKTFLQNKVRSMEKEFYDLRRDLKTDFDDIRVQGARNYVRCIEAQKEVGENIERKSEEWSKRMESRLERVEKNQEELKDMFIKTTNGGENGRPSSSGEASNDDEFAAVLANH